MGLGQTYHAFLDGVLDLLDFEIAEAPDLE